MIASSLGKWGGPAMQSLRHNRFVITGEMSAPKLSSKATSDMPASFIPLSIDVSIIYEHSLFTRYCMRLRK